MPFKSDEQRKAMWANINKGFNKQTKVRKFGSSQNLDVLKHKGLPRLQDKAYNQKELRMGIKEELEHTHSRSVAKMIAKDHLNEIPNYYSLLNQMEKKEGVKKSDIKTKGGRVSCEMCKRRGLSLKKGKCKDCIKETKGFKQPPQKKLIHFDSQEIEILDEVLEDYYDLGWSTDEENEIRDIFDKIKNKRELESTDFSVIREALWKWDDEPDEENERTIESIYDKLSKMEKKPE